MEISHVRFRNIRHLSRFRICAFPERIAVADKKQRVAIVKNAIGIAVVNFDRQFKKLVRITQFFPRSHIRECIRRCTINTNLFNRNAMQKCIFATHLAERRAKHLVADRIHAIFAKSRDVLVTHNQFDKLSDIINFGTGRATQRLT